MQESFSSKLAGITLPDIDGRPTRLGSLWATTPTVVAFLRHYGWIFCREHVAQLREHEQEFQSKGAKLVAIGLGDTEYARQFREDTKIDFPILIDEKREAYKAIELRNASLLHLLRKDNVASRKRAKAGGHRQHRLGKDVFQLGGSFVFAPGNVDRFVHVSETFGDNASPKDILAAIWSSLLFSEIPKQSEGSL